MSKEKYERNSYGAIVLVTFRIIEGSTYVNLTSFMQIAYITVYYTCV